MKLSRGFTLSEILVSLVVVSVGLLALSTLALVGANEFQYNKGRIEALNESMKLNMLLTQYFGQAVKVQSAAPPTASNTGGILTFNYNTMTSAPGDFTLVASFLRDVGGRSVSLTNNPDANGIYQESAIWWRRPSATTAGVLFFYGGPGTGVNRPDYSNQFVSRLTELQFTPEPPAGPRYSAVNVRAVLRYSRPSASRVWCPRADIGGTPSCAAMQGYVVDLEKRFRILLRNNVTSDQSITGGLLPDRPLGLIYFFNPALPVGWSI